MIPKKLVNPKYFLDIEADDPDDLILMKSAFDSTFVQPQSCVQTAGGWRYI